MNSADLIDKCRRYIDSQRTVLWAEYFDLHESDSKEDAARWLFKVISEVMAIE